MSTEGAEILVAVFLAAFTILCLAISTAVMLKLMKQVQDPFSAALLSIPYLIGMVVIIVVFLLALAVIDIVSSLRKNYK